MNWKTFDFNIGTEISRSSLDRLSLYIEKMESSIAHECLKSLVPLLHDAGQAPPALLSAMQLKLLVGVDEFNNKIRQILAAKSKNVEPVRWNQIANALNSILWNFVEFLEGAVEEFICEMERLDIQSWSKELMQIVRETKEVLSYSIHGLEKAYNELNAALAQLRKETDHQRWLIMRMFEGPILDPEILKTLRSCHNILENGFEKYRNIYENLFAIKEELVAAVIKIGTFPVFSTLERGMQQNFLDVYELLRCFEKNRKINLVEEKLLSISLRKLMSKEQAFALFRDYFNALHQELFHQSLEIKHSGLEPITEQGRKKTLEYLHDIQEEVRLLSGTIDRYREFLLSTDPNPYVRARLGFSEWVLGPEPHEAKGLYKFGYNLDSLDRLYTTLIDSVTKGPAPEAEFTSQGEEIEKVLHELGAPFLSERIMERRYEKLISLLESVNELGSFHPQVVPKMGKWIRKALRFDWRYHILHRFPMFHELYAIHMGLVGSESDKLHISRMNKFRRVLTEIREWIVQRETAKHSRDIDLDINDVQGYLQEFFAHVQRSLGSVGEISEKNRDKLVESFSKQLLEYRYLFGYFFHQLNDENAEEYLIHSKCNFVDQYFEAIDKKITDLNPSCDLNRT